MRFNFSQVVVVDDDQIGVIVKSWSDKTYDIYVRSYNEIRQYDEDKVKYYVYNKYLHESEYNSY